MIDIVTEHVTEEKRNLKNIRQIGKPAEEEKVYMEAEVYRKIHREDMSDKHVYVLMGHTECAGGKYSTFIEGAISVKGIDFERNTPIWNNRSWGMVFEEIKREYDDSIIVGWALDLRGFTPRITTELERVHQEQFGGIHQLLFLMDSFEQEEFFYIRKSTHLYQKPGFYIYYSSNERRPIERVSVNVERERERVREREAKEDDFLEIRKIKREAKIPWGSIAMVAMMILLIGVMVIELYQDESRLKEVSNPEPQIEMTEVFEEKIPVNQIPVEEIPGE
ncbi:MAG: hypothetical protein UIC64_09245 [Agathobacter sp.]|nr:hypothetical protein [Agathobacter sp.]